MSTRNALSLFKHRFHVCLTFRTLRLSRWVSRQTSKLCRVLHPRPSILLVPTPTKTALVEKQAERTHVYIRVYVSSRIYERKAVCLHFARRPSEGFQTASTWDPAVGLCPGSCGGPRGVGVFVCARYPCTCFSQGARRKDFWRNTGTCPTLSRTRTPFSIAAISGLRWGQRRASLQLITHV